MHNHNLAHSHRTGLPPRCMPRACSPSTSMSMRASHAPTHFARGWSRCCCCCRSAVPRVRLARRVHGSQRYARVVALVLPAPSLCRNTTAKGWEGGSRKRADRVCCGVALVSCHRLSLCDSDERRQFRTRRMDAVTASQVKY
eukprot:scaffold12319_cov112-Isochrysis_galbana.AAC.7